LQNLVELKNFEIEKKDTACAVADSGFNMIKKIEELNKKIKNVKTVNF